MARVFPRFAFLLLLVGLMSGCGERLVDVKALPGKPLSEISRIYKLDKYESWAQPNLPPGSDAELTYFLDRGNLELVVGGEPAMVKDAHFSPSEKSAKARYAEVGEAWSKWVDAHSEKGEGGLQPSADRTENQAK
jgi:uncharacterized protein YceK